MRTADLDGDGTQELILLRSDILLTAYDVEDTELWSYTDEDAHLQDLYLAYNTNDDGWYVYVVEKFDEPLYKIDATTGEEIWQKPLGDPEGNTRFGAADLDGDGNAEIAVGRSGQIHIYDHEGERIEAGGSCDSADIPGPFGEVVQGKGAHLAGRPIIAAIDGTTVRLYEYRSR